MPEIDLWIHADVKILSLDSHDWAWPDGSPVECPVLIVVVTS